MYLRNKVQKHFKTKQHQPYRSTGKRFYMITTKYISQYLTDELSDKEFDNAQSLLKEIVGIMRYNAIYDNAGYVPCNENELVEMTVSPSIDDVYDGDITMFKLCGYDVTIREYYHDSGSDFYAYVFEVYDNGETYSSLNN